MRRTSLLVFCVVGCGDDPSSLPDAPAAGSLTIEPPASELEVVDGMPDTQAYIVTAHGENGETTNVTGLATLALADPQFGEIAGSTFVALGQGAGVTTIRASWNGATADAMVTVRVRGIRIEPGAPPNAPDIFDGATDDPARAPTFVYPADHVLVPPNLGQLDVHWNDDDGNDLFRVAITNQYVDLRVYTTGVDQQTFTQYWTVMEPAEWYPLASSREPLTVALSGLAQAMPQTMGTSTRTVDVTNEDARGGIYFWSTSQQTIFRYDVERPDIPPARLFASGTGPSGCIGCHTLSRDGTKIAMTVGGESGTGTVFDVATRTPLVPHQPQVGTWNFATFTPDGNELITAQSGVLTVRDVDGGAILATLTLDPIQYATHPELSPDGTKLAYVEHPPESDIYPYDGRVLVRSYDVVTRAVGPPTLIMDNDIDLGVGAYYPSWSPDGEWLAITRTTNFYSGYDNYSGRTWIVPATGGTPVELAIANDAGDQCNSWARWVPFGQTFGAANEPLFYLTYSTRRRFGTRRPYDGGTPQIWMTPVFPARALNGDDPSGPAFRLPFQDLQGANHIAQWTEQVVN